MMYKLIAFDLDNTLAGVGRAIAAKDLDLLKHLERSGVRIAICSGKPTYYLCGFARQLALEQPILVGENGAVIQFGVALPPKQYYVLPYSQQAKESIRLLHATMVQRLPKLWFQPNVTALTPFPTSEAEFSAIDGCIRDLGGQLQDVTVYRHFDSFDIMPNGITKGSGLAHLSRLLDVSPQEIIAVGDGVNDYPMFEYAGLSLGVGVKEPGRVDRDFETTAQVLAYLAELVGAPHP